MRTCVSWAAVDLVRASIIHVSLMCSSLPFPCARYLLCNIQLVHDIPVSWCLIFASTKYFNFLFIILLTNLYYCTSFDPVSMKFIYITIFVFLFSWYQTCSWTCALAQKNKLWIRRTDDLWPWSLAHLQLQHASMTASRASPSPCLSKAESPLYPNIA